MDNRVTEIKQLASELRKLKYGAGGQSVPLQQNQHALSELGVKVLRAIKEYEDWYKETFGNLDD